MKSIKRQSKFHFCRAYLSRDWLVVVDRAPFRRLDLLVLQPFDASSSRHAVRNDDIVYIVRSPAAHQVLEDGASFATIARPAGCRWDAAWIVGRWREGCAVFIHGIRRQSRTLPTFQKGLPPIEFAVFTAAVARLLPLVVGLAFHRAGQNIVALLSRLRAGTPVVDVSSSWDRRRRRWWRPPVARLE